MSTVVGGRPADPYRLDALAWWRLWSLAALIHVLGNGLTLGFELRSIPNLLLGLISLAVIVDPGRRAMRTALVVGLPISMAAEMPFIGNHWVLAGAVSLAAMAARPWESEGEWLRRFSPSGRVILLVFYPFAAFAKLNEGFFDDSVSCARFFADQLAMLWQLPSVGEGSLLAQVLPFVTVAIELSVPVLLVVRRTRRVGVWLAITFHLVLTLDLIQNFADFTMVLLPLFLLFASEGTLADFDARLPRAQVLGGWPWLVLAAGMVVATTMPVPDDVRTFAVLTARLTWFILAWIIFRRLVLRPPRASSEPLAFRPTSVGSAAVIALMVLNGLSPYLELKSGFGFNMYSNLTAAAGETNHFIVPATLELRNDQSETAIILASSDEDFAEYVDSGFALPTGNLRHYLAANPDIAVTFTFDGELFDLERAGDHPEWTVPLPWYLERFAPFRAVPIDDPPPCQPSFLPAR